MLDGAKIRSLRISADMTAEELGLKVGLRPTMISFIENEVKPTNTEKAQLLAKALGVTVNDLLRD